MSDIKIEGVGFNLSSYDLQSLSKDQFIARESHQSLWPGVDATERSNRLALAWEKAQEEKGKNTAPAPAKPAAAAALSAAKV